MRRELADNFCWYSPKYASSRARNTTGPGIPSATTPTISAIACTPSSSSSRARPTINYGTPRSSRWCTAGRCTASCACMGEEDSGVDGEPGRAGDLPFTSATSTRSTVETRADRRLRVVHRGRARPGLERTPRFGEFDAWPTPGARRSSKFPTTSRVNQLVSAVRAGEKSTAAVNPGRFHIDFAAHKTQATAGFDSYQRYAHAVHRRGARADGEGGGVRGDGRHGAGGGRAQGVRKPPSPRTLAETGAGKEIKRLSKQGENTDVAAAATAVVNAWKRAVMG